MALMHEIATGELPPGFEELKEKSGDIGGPSAQKCEPPASYRDRRWHWLARHGHGKKPYQWDTKKGVWWTGFGSWTPEDAARNGATYWAPVEEPPKKAVHGDTAME